MTDPRKRPRPGPRPLRAVAPFVLAAWVASTLACSRSDIEPDDIMRTIDGHPPSGAERATGDLRRIGWTRKGAGPCWCVLSQEVDDKGEQRTAATISCPEGPSNSLDTKDDTVTLTLTLRHFAMGPWTSTTTWDTTGLNQRGVAEVTWLETWRDGTESAEGTGQALVQFLSPVPYQESADTVPAYPVILDAASVWRDDTTPTDAPADGEITNAWVYCLGEVR